MKLRIDKEEWWPVYAASEDGEVEAEIDPLLVTRIHYAFKEFWDIQKILRVAYDNGNPYE